MRNEGYMPKNEFRAWLEMSLARLAFLRKDWDDAERRYTEVVARLPETSFAPEAVYWKGVSRYKNDDHLALGETAISLKRDYPSSLWAAKASVWGG